MNYRVILTPSARQNLLAIADYISAESSDAIAADFCNALLLECESFSVFPKRGSVRGDVRSGMRVISFRKRVSVAFEVTEDAVNILAFWYAGRNWTSALL